MKTKENFLNANQFVVNIMQQQLKFIQPKKMNFSGHLLKIISIKLTVLFGWEEKFLIRQII
jgi:hypothetical protein